MKPAITLLYRINIGKNNQKENIGDIVKLSYKYYSEYLKSYIFGEPSGKSWTWALDIKESDNNSISSFNRFIKNLNEEDKFYQYTTDKAEAEKIARKSVNDYTKQKWTLTKLLEAIQNDKDLMSLKYNYHLKITGNQSGTQFQESIYVSGLWRIRVNGCEILIDRAGWYTYKVPNLQCLYKVIAADSDSDKDETTRRQYSKLV